MNNIKHFELIKDFFSSKYPNSKGYRGMDKERLESDLRGVYHIFLDTTVSL